MSNGSMQDAPHHLRYPRPYHASTGTAVGVGRLFVMDAVREAQSRLFDK